MCTVTFIPTQSNQFIFTSNRDEAPNRAASELIKEDRDGKLLLFPQDQGANGSWIVLSETNQLVCILNGAFVRHERNPPYRISRGIMALDYFKFASAQSFFEEYNFQKIEAFTMVIYDQGDLYELRWDEHQKHIKKLPTNEMHLWASATLYNDDLQQKRLKWFEDWKHKTSKITRESVLDFHKNAGEGNPESDIVMNYKGIVCTTSITSIVNNGKSMYLRFEELNSHKILEDSVGLL